MGAYRVETKPSVQTLETMNKTTEFSSDGSH
jgi:hypothetical protein